MQSVLPLQPPLAIWLRNGMSNRQDGPILIVQNLFNLPPLQVKKLPEFLQNESRVLIRRNPSI